MDSSVSIIRTARKRRAVEAWALVLASQGIASQVIPEGGAWHLAVPAEQAADAEQLIETYELENAPPPPDPDPPPEYGPTQAGFLLGAAIVLFFLVTGPRDPDVAWFAEGSARASAIARGEWWRTVTALTLHADLSHVFGNAISCAIFATAVCRSYGPGAGGALILLSGIGGNLVNAAYHGSLHSSVGASTALFGAIGVLTGTQVARWRSRRRDRGRAWVPLAGGLGLLAMLGTGEGSDLFAHVFGLLVGTALGVLAGIGITRSPGGAAQAALGAAAVGSVLAAWRIALGQGA